MLVNEQVSSSEPTGTGEPVRVRPRSLRLKYAAGLALLTAFFGLIAALAVSGP
jgi:hypothetical protein